MSSLNPYIALAIFPLVMLLVPNPVAFAWGFKRGFTPMPPDVAERSGKAGRYTVFLMHALILALVLSLMSTHSVPASRVGLLLDHWPIHLLPGLAAGLLWIGLYGLLVRLSPVLRQDLTTDLRREGSLFSGS